MKFNKAQIIIIAVLAAMVAILVYLNFKTPNINPEELSEAGKNKTVLKEFNFDAYMLSVKDSLNSASANLIDELLNVAQKDSSNIYPLLELSHTYDSLGFSIASGYYLRQIADKLNDETSWYRAGFKFYEIAATVTDSAIQLFAISKAIESFEKVIAINSKNTEAKNALAICYIKNDADIMKGVQLLKDVIKTDSSNIDAIYTLGILSIRSGQTDKALDRFKKLTELQPMNADFHYYLGECYLETGKNKEAIKSFETFQQLVPDEEAKRAIQQTIINLKNKN